MTTPQPRRAASPRVAIVAPYGSLDTIPYVGQLADHLAERWQVDVIAPPAPGGGPGAGSAPPAPGDDDAAARVRHLAPPAFLQPLMHAPVSDPAPAALPRRLRALAPIDPTLAARWRRLRPERYDVVIGIDAEGLVAGAALADAVGARLAYWSMELLPTADLETRAERILKWRETRLARRAEPVIIQDEDRAAFLVTENRLDPSRIVLAPNAPSGAARRRRSTTWHDRLGLAPDRRILLQAGSLPAWSGVDEAVAGAADLPEPWVLVVHSNGRPGAAERIAELAGAAHGTKVFFSTDAVDRHAYRDLLDGADAGLALYRPGTDRWNNTNLRRIGLSSGKVSHYLWCGLPVIVSDATTLGPLVSEHELGVTLTGASTLAAAVRVVDANLARFGANAVRFFDERLDFDRSAERIEAALLRAVGTMTP